MVTRNFCEVFATSVRIRIGVADKMRLLASVSTAALLSAGSAQAQTAILVTNGADSGEGSLRAALSEAAGRDAGATVVIEHDGEIEISAPLVYAGRAPLQIIGRGSDETQIEADGDFTLLAASEGADLTVVGVTLRGVGGFDIENRSDDAGKGVFVDVRDDQTGLVTLTLTDVVVDGVANHGVHVSDCNLADDCGGGGGGAGEGSDASIAVHLVDVVVSDAGNGRFDADGLRVDERGAGSIHVTMTASRFSDVGADGVELDEGQAGDVRVLATNVQFVDNGAYCDPELLASFLPDPDEGDFEEGAFAEADVPPAVEGSPDDSCIEREVDLYDDGSVEEYAFGIDLDDGFDIDEAGDGDIDAVIIDATISDNLDEGLDFDEEDAGGIFVSMIRNEATGNTDDGFKFTEEDDGDVVAIAIGSEAVSNGGKGFVFEQEDGGALEVMLEGVSTRDNDDGDDTGVEVVSEGEQQGDVVALGSAIEDGFDLDGAALTEE